MNAVKLTLYAKRQCAPCEAAKFVLDRVCSKTAAEYEVIYIDYKKDLKAKYSKMIPVIAHNDRIIDSLKIRESNIRNYIDSITL
jgi:hypothetical protein